MRILIYIYIFVSVLLVCYGCDQSNAPGEQTAIDPAIVFGESIAQVQIENDSSAIVKKLGHPDTTESGTTVYDTYYYDKNTFVITYNNQRIIRISMSNPKHK